MVVALGAIFIVAAVFALVLCVLLSLAARFVVVVAYVVVMVGLLFIFWLLRFSMTILDFNVEFR